MKALGLFYYEGLRDMYDIWSSCLSPELSPFCLQLWSCPCQQRKRCLLAAQFCLWSCTENEPDRKCSVKDKEAGSLTELQSWRSSVTVALMQRADAASRGQMPLRWEPTAMAGHLWMSFGVLRMNAPSKSQCGPHYPQFPEGRDESEAVVRAERWGQCNRTVSSLKTQSLSMCALTYDCSSYTPFMWSRVFITSQCDGERKKYDLREGKMRRKIKKERRGGRIRAFQTSLLWSTSGY